MTTRAEQWLSTHKGDRCSDCGTTYAACTKRIFDKGMNACCVSCYTDETHNSREKRSNTMSGPRTTSRPGNIDHKQHTHPLTSHWQGRCRKSVLAGNGPIRLAGAQVGRYDALIQSGVDPDRAWNDAWKWPVVEEDGPKRREEGNGQTFEVKAEPDLPEGYALIPVERPAVIVPIGVIQELDHMLAEIDPLLDGFAVTKSAVIRFDKDGMELAAVWNGEAWAVEVR